MASSSSGSISKHSSKPNSLSKSVNCKESKLRSHTIAEDPEVVKCPSISPSSFEDIPIFSYNPVSAPNNYGSIIANKPQAVDSEQVKFIDLSQPADIELARIHGRANKVTILSGVKVDEHSEVCDCCHMPLGQARFPFCGRLFLLGELGASFPLYYIMARGLIVALSLCFSIACIMCIVDNLTAGRYTEWTDSESSNLMTPADFGNIWLSEAERNSQGLGRASQIPIWQPILHISACVMLMILYPIILKKIKKDSVDINIVYDSPSDYTLFLKGLPNKYTKEDLERHIIKNFPEHNVDIVNIVCTYDITEYSRIAKELTGWEMKFDFIQKYVSKYNKIPVRKGCCKEIPYETAEECEKNIKKLGGELSEYIKTMSIDELTPFAFVTFNSQVQTREIGEVWNPSAIKSILNYFCCCCAHGRFKFKGKYIKAEMAPESCDINWENLAVGNYKKLCERLLTLIMMIFTLVITFLAVYFTAQWKLQEYNKDNNNQMLQGLTVATIVPSIVTVVVNVMVARLMRLFATIEKHNTWSEYNGSVMDRLVVFMFVNTVLIHVAVYSDHHTDWFVEGGLIYSVFWLQIMNAGLSPLVYMISPNYQLQRIKRYFAVKAANAGTLQMTQRDANELFKGPDVDLADRFASLLKTCCLSLFFAPIVPIGVLIGMVALMMEIGVFNFMLLRVHCRPRRHNVSLVIRAVKWIPWVILVYSIGIVGFYYYLTPDIVWLCWLNLFLSLFYVLTPFSYLFLKCFRDNTIEYLKTIVPASTTNEYFSHLPSFYSDYERDNPITSTTGWERWNLFMENRDPEAYRTLKNPIVLDREFLNNLPTGANNYFSRIDFPDCVALPNAVRENNYRKSCLVSQNANQFVKTPTIHSYSATGNCTDYNKNGYTYQNPSPYLNANSNLDPYQNAYPHSGPNEYSYTNPERQDPNASPNPEPTSSSSSLNVYSCSSSSSGNYPSH